VPRVSVLLPVENDQRRVGAAIDSVLQQTLTDFELLVLDDGSTDGTLDVVRERAARDARVKLLRQSVRLGLAGTLNAGLAACRAPFVARMASYARCDPRRLEQQVAWLDANPFTALVGSDAAILDANGHISAMSGGPAAYEDLRAGLARGPAVVPETMLWRRRDIESIGLYAVDAELAGGEDYELVVRVSARFRIDNIKETLTALAAGERQPAAPAALARVARLARELLSGERASPVDVEAPAPQPPARPRGRIFVAIAAYRDPELAPTIDDLFARAAHPDEVTVGVCLQYDPRADARAADLPTRPDQITVVHVHPSETLGLGWARHVSERLWRGEPHVLQIDSHMRFADQWDDRLLAQLDRCDSRFPGLTTYPPGFTPPRGLQHGPPPRLRALHFTPEGLLRLGGTVDRPGDRHGDRPTRTAFFAGGYAFFAGDFLREVPNDPLMYFNATEPTHMVRAWTAGWDFFTPSENLLYHLYAVEAAEKPLHWRDRPGWSRLAARGQARARHLLGMEETDDPDALLQLDRYALGSFRTLDAYQRFAGVDFRARSVSPMAADGRVNPRNVRARR
jgi:glycosyltransferase involved in cell wall biosynthesis